VSVTHGCFNGCYLWFLQENDEWVVQLGYEIHTTRKTLEEAKQAAVVVYAKYRRK
jgi:hypothetical protein